MKRRKDEAPPTPIADSQQPTAAAAADRFSIALARRRPLRDPSGPGPSDRPIVRSDGRDRLRSTFRRRDDVSKSIARASEGRNAGQDAEEKERNQTSTTLPTSPTPTSTTTSMSKFLLLHLPTHVLNRLRKHLSPNMRLQKVPPTPPVAADSRETSLGAGCEGEMGRRARGRRRDRSNNKKNSKRFFFL